MKIDVTQTPRPTRPTTAIPVRAAEVPPRSTMARSRSGPLRGNSNRYAHPYNRHCIRREPVALSAGRGCDSNFTLSLTLTLYCRLQIGFERYTLPGPTRSQGTRWLIADRLCAHLLRRNEPSPQVCHHAASSLVFPGPPKTAVERRRRQVSPHTPRRVRAGVRAHQLLRMRLGRGPRAPEQACAHPLVACTAATQVAFAAYSASGADL